MRLLHRAGVLISSGGPITTSISRCQNPSPLPSSGLADFRSCCWRPTKKARATCCGHRGRGTARTRSGPAASRDPSNGWSRRLVSGSTPCSWPRCSASISIGLAHRHWQQQPTGRSMVVVQRPGSSTWTPIRASRLRWPESPMIGLPIPTRWWGLLPGESDLSPGVLGGRDSPRPAGWSAPRAQGGRRGRSAAVLAEGGR